MGSGQKKAIKGFSRLKLYPITSNSATEYQFGTGFFLPEAQSMTREDNTSETPIYADDELYLNNAEWLGQKVVITLAEIELEMIAKLGFGKYDAIKKVLSLDPQGKNLSFLATWRALLANGEYRMFKALNLTVSIAKDSGLKSKGTGGEIATFHIEGTCTKRKCDDEFLLQKDSEDGDLTWLDDLTELQVS